MVADGGRAICDQNDVLAAGIGDGQLFAGTKLIGQQIKIEHPLRARVVQEHQHLQLLRVRQVAQAHVQPVIRLRLARVVLLQRIELRQPLVSAHQAARAPIHDHWLDQPDLLHLPLQPLRRRPERARN